MINSQLSSKRQAKNIIVDVDFKSSLKFTNAENDKENYVRIWTVIENCIL